uniref:Uncharacterized protein n=1 Tax=Leersia perrieri TaxID=77586 RepID=A0A0D9XR00_9ORYZ
MARKAEVRALAAAIEGANAVILAAPAPVPPLPSPLCPPRRCIADTVVHAIRSSPSIFVLASLAPLPPSLELRPPMHAIGKRFTLAARHGACPFYESQADGVSIITEDTSSEESSLA